jgi:hypothetical protein
MTKKSVLGAALSEFLDSLESSNDDDASLAKNESRYLEILESYQDPATLDKAAPKVVVESFYTLAEFLTSDLPENYEDLMPDGMDGFFCEDVYEAFEIVGFDNFPAEEIDRLIIRQKEDGVLDVGTSGPRWLATKVLKRQQYFDLWEMSSTMDSEFSDGYKEKLVQNPMTPKKLLLEAAENGWHDIRKYISENPKVDNEILEVLRRHA